MRVNMIGTYNVLEAAQATIDTVERLVDLSTSEVFGRHAYKVEEIHETAQGSVGRRWTYAVSKLAGEHMAHAYYDEFAADVLDPAVQRLRAGPDRRRRDPCVHRDGARRRGLDHPRRRPQVRAWCYVDDLVDALLLVLERPEAVGEVFNVGNERSVLTVLELATQIRDLMSSEAEIKFRPCTTRRRDADPERRQGAQAARLGGQGRPRRGAQPHDRVVSGTPAGTDVIRLAWLALGEEELAAVAEVLESGQLTMGPKVAEFEDELARACEVEHAVAVSSGTAALHLAVLALGIGPGDEVIVPAYTFPATANVVALAGAQPVLVDVDPETMNLRPEAVADALTERTRAVLVVHLFGRPARWGEIEAAVPDGVVLIEDAAGALGARRGGRACGGLGGSAVSRSTHARSSPPARAVRSRRTTLSSRRRSGRRHHGWRDADMPEPGLNYRLPDILCALGVTQLRRLEQLLEERERLRRLPRASRGSRRASVRRRGRQARLAGVHRPGRPARRGARNLARRGSKPRSAPTRSIASAPIATRGRSRARTPRTSERLRCLSTTG